MDSGGKLRAWPLKVGMFLACPDLHGKETGALSGKEKRGMVQVANLPR